MRILILNGPNLNLLGQRERSLYGNQTLGELEQSLRKQGQSLGIEVECYQSNLEGYLIDALQRARNRCQAVVFNPGGYTHTSVALRDAIAAIDIPVIEVHMTNIHGREDFRRVSLTAGACVGQISGLGFLSYEMALNALVRMLKAAPAQPQPSQPAVRPDRERVEARPEARAEGGRPEGRPAEAREQREGGFEGGERGDEGREGKRRRRGRRGGRGRRRDGMPGEEGGAPREEEQRREQELPDASERYANLKGVTVRRGVDVLADEEPPEPVKTGVVTFEDAPKPEPAHEVVAAVQVQPRQETPAAPSKPAPPAPEPPKREAPAPAPAQAAAPKAPEPAAAEAAPEQPRPRKVRPRKAAVVRKTTPKKRASAKHTTTEHNHEEEEE